MLVGWLTIWSRGMVSICAHTALWMAASLDVDDVMVDISAQC